MPVSQSFQSFLKLIRFDKPIGSLLLLWPTLWALTIANDGQPSWKLLFIFIIGVVLMRSAGCIMNDIADRNFDGHVARTHQRPLVTGEVSLIQAVIYLLVLLSLAFTLVCFTNIYTIKLAFVGAALALIYPFMKRFIQIPQAFLGLAFAWGIPMVFAASQNAIPAVAWMLFFGAMMWPIAYDTMYAMVDIDDDKKIGIKSSALFFGQYDKLIIAICQLSLLGSHLIIAWMIGPSIYYVGGIVAAAALCVFQQRLIRHRDPKQCFDAFLNNQWVGAAIMIGLMGHYQIHDYL